MTTITIERELLERVSALLDEYDAEEFDSATVSDVRAALAAPATAPAWHDAPTCAGLWVCRQAITDNVQAYEVTDQVALNRNLKLKGQWYGPIPEDK